MTFREIGKDELLGRLGDVSDRDDAVLRACLAALRADSQRVYTVGGSPAMVLRETLELKYRRAASRGKTLVGDDELLLRLQELGSDPVAIFSAHHRDRHFYTYALASTLQPIGAVIMYDPQAKA